MVWTVFDAGSDVTVYVTRFVPPPVLLGGCQVTLTESDDASAAATSWGAVGGVSGAAVCASAKASVVSPDVPRPPDAPTHAT